MNPAISFVGRIFQTSGSFSHFIIPARSRAFRKTLVSIASVSLPVEVFCWLE